MSHVNNMINFEYDTPPQILCTMYSIKYKHVRMYGVRRTARARMSANCHKLLTFHAN